MYGEDICVELKGWLWNSTQNILPIHWQILQILLLYTLGNLWALRFKSSYGCLNAHPGTISIMRTTSHGRAYRFTGTFWGESTGHRWIPLTKASDADLCCLLLIATWINCWTYNWVAGNLGHRDSHLTSVWLLWRAEATFHGQCL